MAQKNFKKSASDFFINEAGNDPKQEAPKRNRTGHVTTEAPKRNRTGKVSKDIPPGYEVPKGWKLTREARSERIQLLVRPSTKDKLKAEADRQHRSLNEYVNDILEQYIERGLNNG